MELNKINILDKLETLGYQDLIIDDKNHTFIAYLKEKNLKKENLSINLLKTLWFNCFKQEIPEKNIKSKYKFFTEKKQVFKINYIEKLPSINTYSTTILVLSEQKNNFLENWNKFEKEYYESSYIFYELKKKHFSLTPNLNDYNSLLEESLIKDESIRKENSQKKLYLSFFLFLAGKGYCLLPCLYIYSSDSFFYYATNLKLLEFFQRDHFFVKKPIQSHLIENELKGNNKAKYIFYLRFSYLVNKSIKELITLSDENISKIFLILKNSEKSEKMTDDNENPIRKILIWHGALNISETKKIANEIILSPLEILSQAKNTDIYLLDAFAKYFSNKPNNNQQRKFAKLVIDFLVYINNQLGNITFEKLKDFFYTSILSKNNFDGEIKSDFLTYLKNSNYGMSLQQDLQLLVFQVIENSDKYAGCYPKSCLTTLYRSPNRRKIRRLAFDKKIINRMKRICLLNPPTDNYYIKTNLDKKNMLWQHFDIIEPQLPVMLFLHLCMPWRTEHIISLDRETFLIKDDKNNIIGWRITTDKNQDNDFQIEKEFIDHVFFFEDEKEGTIDVMRLLDETIEYSKKSFPLFKALLRKENKNWGEIKPILCKKNAIGFIPDSLYKGYYYKVLLKALFELNFSPQEIQYYVQLSEEGKKLFEKIPLKYDSIEELSLATIIKSFNSEYFGPHSLRKTNITHLIQNGKVFEFILKLSGHTSRSTVLQIYIDYDFLAKLTINEEIKTNILEKFENNNTRLSSRQIINNLKKYHMVDNDEIKKILKEKELFFSPNVLSDDKKYIKKNDNESLKILSPNFWQDLSTGICSNALNCPNSLNNRCSLCPFFITGPIFFNAINSKIMQLSTKISEYYKIIEENLINENLNHNEAELYEEELQLLLAENYGYSVIIDSINNFIYDYIYINSSEKNNLPISTNFSLINYEHIPFYNAQLEIYKISKKNDEHNFSTQFAIEEVYKKILELILLNELPKDIFYEQLSNKEKMIDCFINYIDNSKLTTLNINLLSK